MNSHEPKPRSTTRPHRYGVATWMLAGVLGMTCSVFIALARPFELSLLLTAIVAIGAGWLVMTLFSPWRRVLSSRADRREIRRLAQKIRRVGRGEERAVLENLLVERDDEIGELGRAIHGVMAEVLSNRQSEQRLRREMDHNIKKETRLQTARLQKQAFTDPLTRLGNRRALASALEKLKANRATNNVSVVAMVLDLDKFKDVNDSLGHETGDRCLSFLGDLLHAATRGDDIAVRWGGDEFIVIMPGQEIDDARIMAQRLAELYAQLPWSHASVDRPTLSIGLASCKLHQLGDGQALLRQADEALYRAKREGRNQVIAYADASSNAA